MSQLLHGPPRPPFPAAAAQLLHRRLPSMPRPGSTPPIVPRSATDGRAHFLPRWRWRRGRTGVTSERRSMAADRRWWWRRCGERPSCSPPPRRPSPAAGLPPPPPASSPAISPAQLSIDERSEKKKRREEERWRGEGEEAVMWDPHGSHAESAATSDKIGVKTAEGPSLHWFYKLGDVLYLVLRFKDDFVTQLTSGVPFSNSDRRD